MKIPKWFMKLTKITSLCDACGYKEKLDMIECISDPDLFIGKKCPKCGHNMINENDIEKMKNALKNFHVDPHASSNFNIKVRTKRH